jgi:hypothetical protein
VESHKRTLQLIPSIGRENGDCRAAGERRKAHPCRFLLPLRARRDSGLPDLTYRLHDRDALVTACCRICMHRKRLNISTALAGQRLGIKEVDDGIWIVSFMHYDLGFIDLEQKTLQPLDNPFGTGLSPMS